MTKLQKEIVELMKLAGIQMECCKRAMAYLTTPEQQKKMLDYLKKNPTTSNKQIMIKTKEIIEN